MKQQYKKVQYKDYTGIVTGNQENTNGVQLGDIYIAIPKGHKLYGVEHTCIDLDVLSSCMGEQLKTLNDIFKEIEKDWVLKIPVYKDCEKEKIDIIEKAENEFKQNIDEIIARDVRIDVLDKIEKVTGSLLKTLQQIKEERNAR